jgi:hypothetical protein
MRKDAIYKGYWHYGYENNHMANSHEEAKKAAKSAATQFEQPPKDKTKCLLLELPLGAYHPTRDMNYSNLVQKSAKRFMESFSFGWQALY